MQVAAYLGDSSAQAEAAAAFASLVLAPHHASHADAVTEVLHLPSNFASHVLCAATAPLATLIAELPPSLHAAAVTAHTETRRFVPGVVLQRGTGLQAPPFGRVFAAAAPHLRQCDWLDVSGSALGAPDCAAAVSTADSPTRAAADTSNEATFRTFCPFNAAFPSGGADASPGSSDSCGTMATAQPAPITIVVIGPHLATLTALQSLDLTDNALAEAGAIALAPHLPPLRHLQDLFLGRNALGRGGAAALAAPLAGLAAMQLLDLSDNGLDDSAIALLAPRLAPLSHLQTLDVSSNAMTGAGVAAAAAAFATGAAAPRCLFASLNPLGTAPPAALAAPLAALTHLADLDLSCSRLGDSAAAALAAPLAALTRLVRLDLCHNGLTAAAATALGAPLATLPALADVTLAANPLGDTGAVALATHLPAFPALELLDLSHAGIAVEGARMLGPALARAANLTRLALSGNGGIGDDGAMALGVALGDCEGLQEVDLSDCGMQEEVWQTAGGLPSSEDESPEEEVITPAAPVPPSPVARPMSGSARLSRSRSGSRVAAMLRVMEDRSLSNGGVPMMH